MIRQSPIALAIGFALVAVLALVVVANAQTPTEGGATAAPTDGDATPAGEPTPGDVQETNGRVFIVVPDGELDEGETFEAEIRVEDAEHVAAYSFTLQFDPAHLSVPDQDASTDGVQIGRGFGAFLDTSERGANKLCNDPEIKPENRISVVCLTNDPPVCLGGPAGASGSGSLGFIEFSVISSGNTELTLPAARFVLDDVEPCNPDQDPTQADPVINGATVNVKSDGLPWLIISGVVAVLGVLIAGAAFAYIRTRQGASGD